MRNSGASSQVSNRSKSGEAATSSWRKLSGSILPLSQRAGTNCWTTTSTRSGFGSRVAAGRLWKKNARGLRAHRRTPEARDGGRSDDWTEMDAEDNGEGGRRTATDRNYRLRQHRCTIAGQAWISAAHQREEDRTLFT